MPPLALGAVLLSATLHAGWNALLKAEQDRAGSIAAIAACHALIGLSLAIVAPAPNPDSWIFIFLSTLLHYAYYMALFMAYRDGDLGVVYPISRGMAPALVACSALFFIGESLSPAGWIGLATVTSGIFLLAANRAIRTAQPRALVIAAVLGIIIAAYSLTDGIGVRLSHSTAGYIGWLFLFEAPVPLWLALRRYRSKQRPFSRRTLIQGSIGGCFSVAAYSLTLFAATLAPLGAVSAVRESSVVIAALIGVIWFGERPWQIRLAASVLVAIGVALLAIGA